MSMYKKEYDTLLTDEKRRRERNIRLLAKLENIEKKAAFLQAKTDRIKSLKGIYKNHYGKPDTPMYYNSQMFVKKQMDTYNEIYEERRPFNINSCYITKNITLDEAIEELSKRFVLIPKISNNKGNNYQENEIRQTPHEIYNASVKSPVENNNNKNDISNNCLKEEIIEENRQFNNEDNFHVEDSKNNETPENSINEENKNLELENTNSQKLEFKENETIQNEISDSSEITEKPKLNTNSKLMHLTREIAHVDEMGLNDLNNTKETLLQDNIQISNEIIENSVESQEYMDKDDNDEKESLEIVKNIENHPIENELEQKLDNVEQNQYQNINEGYDDSQYIDNSNLNQEINYQQVDPQNYNETQEVVYEQQQYFEDNSNENKYFEESSDNQLIENNMNYSDENVQKTQQINENNEQYYEHAEYTDEQSQQYYEQADDQPYDNMNNDNSNNVENNDSHQNYTEQIEYEEIPNNENLYDKQSFEVGENYENTESTSNNLENNMQIYENYDNQNVQEGEQYNYNNYENQDDSQQYDTTVGEDTQSNIEPQEIYQNEPAKPLQIFESDIEQISTKEENSVQESDFDFSTQ